MTVGLKTDRTLRGVGSFTFTDIDSGLILNLQKPVNFSIQHNPVQGRIQTTDNQGYMVYGESYPKGYDYTLSIQSKVMQPEILQFKFNTKFKPVTSKTVDIPINIVVFTNTVAGVASGYYGYSIEEDAEATFSKTVGNVSTELTQVDYASFSASTPDTFAVGDHRELKFSNNLIDLRVSGIISCDFTSGLENSTETTGSYKVNANILVTDDEVIKLTIPKVTPDLNGAGFTPDADGVDLPFFIAYVEGQKPYDLFYTGQRISL